MIARVARIALSGPAAAAGLALALACAQPATAFRDSTAPAVRHSDYTVRAVCGVPAPGHARCMAMELVPRTAAAQPGGAQAPAPAAEGTPSTTATTPAAAGPSAPSPAAGEFGLRPQDLHAAYLLPASAPDSQTIALVDAYNDPTAEADLATYSTEFGLPACTVSNGCFRQVNQEGNEAKEDLPFPRSEEELTRARKAEPRRAAEATDWGGEMSLDIETAHAVCETCRIVLVEADTPAYANLESAENAAATLGATEISDSWGGPECASAHDCESSTAFDHPGIVITASAGDEGYLNWLEAGGPSYANFPATSPEVVAVGGTRLQRGTKGEWAGETVWNDGGESGGEKEGVGATGGGCSAQFTAPPWQQAVADWSAVGCGEKRAASDVAADADPYSGVAVYDSNEECVYLEGKTRRTSHWCSIGGTSLASPLIAATFALAGGAAGVEHPAKTLYENAVRYPGSLHDVTEGSNGECTSPFDEETGVSGCTSAKEAKASCNSHAVCLAGSGYDGPTGLGTPDGLSAFTLRRKPTVQTLAATAIAQTTATLRASVDPNGLEVSECKLEFGTTSVSEHSAPCSPAPGEVTEAVAVSAVLKGLTANTSYRFRVVADNTDGTSTGSEGTYTTLPEAPVVRLGSAPEPARRAATVHASVNPNGVPLSECELEYGVGASGPYEGSVPCSPSPGSGTQPEAVSGSLTGLSPSTAYHYRLVASNAGGTSDSEVGALTTLASPPTVVTGASSEVTQTSATLTASVNPNSGQVSACAIEYGPTAAYGSSVSCSPSPGSGSAAVVISAAVSGLSPGGSYHYRVVATNPTGTEWGEDATFTTKLPTVPQEPMPGSATGPQPSPPSPIPAVPGPVPPSPPEARLLHTTLRTSAAGTVTIQVSCPATVTRCVGTVTLRTLVPDSSAATHEQSKAAVLTITSGAFEMAGGHTAIVRLHLLSRVRALLASTHVLRARAIVSTRTPTGAQHIALVLVTIRQSR